MAVVHKEVLIIDDDKDIRLILRRILEGAGMSVTEATTVKEAHQIMRERAPHLVIVDLALGGKETGFHFIAQCRKDVVFAKIPLLVLSASKDRTIIFNAMSLGASDYIVKPVNSSLLLQKVRKALSLEGGIARIVFAKDKRPQITLVIMSRITKISEAGFVVEAPLKVVDQTPGKPVRADIWVRAPLLDEMGATRRVFRPTARVPQASKQAQGQYLTEFLFFGLTNEIVARIKKVIAKF
jgi:CheY-like chemotaxis protein